MQKVNVRTFDLNLLALFVTLWETRSVTRASDRLALSQPAVSHALRRLRGAMGDELFVSTKGGLVPTARGEALIGPVRDALEQIERALQEREAFVPALSQREFNIAATDYFEFSILPQLVEHVSSQAPGIVIRLAPVPEGETASQLLESGDLDAIVSAHPAKGMGIAHEMLDEVSLTTMIWKSEGAPQTPLPVSAVPEAAACRDPQPAKHDRRPDPGGTRRAPADRGRRAELHGDADDRGTHRVHLQRT